MLGGKDVYPAVITECYGRGGMSLSEVILVDILAFASGFLLAVSIMRWRDR